MKKTYEIWVKRNKTNFGGDLSLITRDLKGKVIEAESIRNLEILTGQRLKFKPEWDWVSGKGGGCPEGKLWLHIDPKKIKQPFELIPKGSRIGRFYPISSHPSESTKTVNPSTGGYRVCLGLHFENAYPGSLGCVVPQKEPDWRRIVFWLTNVANQGVKSIPLNVFRPK